jgi:hypothetical protein
VPELFCEEVAHQAGFIVSVGNWIAPDGTLITGKDYDTHHWETIKKYVGFEPATDNHLSWMNHKMTEGFIRLVFRNDVLFQVGSEKKEDIWSDKANMTAMRTVIGKLLDVEIHIFSKTFYVVGLAQDILEQAIDRLQIQEK